MFTLTMGLPVQSAVTSVSVSSSARHDAQWRDGRRKLHRVGQEIERNALRLEHPTDTRAALFGGGFHHFLGAPPGSAPFVQFLDRQSRRAVLPSPPPKVVWRYHDQIGFVQDSEKSPSAATPARHAPPEQRETTIFAGRPAAKRIGSEAKMAERSPHGFTP